YLQGNIGCDIKSMQKRLEEWEYVWNHVRPHEALDYLTPDEYLDRLQFIPLSTQKVIVLQT
ncbi:MAG: integrase core domain-containing protein, partial [Candidatus Nealsonbacteria bacterium]|nr:integrase core domain-containing protein [Candidatus Nealsonbacteria bacterium]